MLVLYLTVSGDSVVAKPAGQEASYTKEAVAGKRNFQNKMLQTAEYASETQQSFQYHDYNNHIISFYVDSAYIKYIFYFKTFSLAYHFFLL